MADRVYQLGALTKDALDNAKYNDNTSVAYTFANQPQIFISDWDNVKSLDKTNINTKALAEGFTQVS